MFLAGTPLPISQFSFDLWLLSLVSSSSHSPLTWVSIRCICSAVAFFLSSPSYLGGDGGSSSSSAFAQLGSLVLASSG
jgi:hypothetical protein